MSEQLPPMPDDLRALLDAARPPEPPEGFEARVFSKVSATLALPSGSGGAGGAPTGGPSSGAASAGGAIALQKSSLVLGGLLLLGAGVVGGVLLERTLLAPTPPPLVAPVPPQQPVKVDAPAAAAPEPVVAAAPKVEEPRRPAPLKPPAGTRDTELSAERALLEVARTSLSKGDLAATLEAVRKHERDFPRGRLEEEREVLFIQALVQSGQRSDAVKRAAAFRARFPDSLMLPAVDVHE